MLQSLRSLFSKPAKAPPAKVPEGTRYYAIGDIHGRLDLFEATIKAIEADDAARAPANTTVVLLGDLVDRGPESAGVISRTRQWQQERKVRILAGNHEEMFLQSFNDIDVLRHFLKHGGRETIMSYGLTKSQFASLTLQQLYERLPELVPQAERDYINAFEDMIIAGDFLFVHAGIDPSVPLDRQKRKDMLWIRDRFLQHKGPLEKVVVHGHTICDEVLDCGNRIGLDTGAFRSGVLTSLMLEGDQRHTLQAIEVDGHIKIVSGD